MYSAKKVLPVPLSPYRMTGVAAGANVCARDTASTITGANAMGACDDGCERRSETRRGVVTRLETFARRRKNHYGLPTGASGGSAPNVTRDSPKLGRRATTKSGRRGTRPPILAEARQHVYARRAAKNSRINSAHASASTPPLTSTR